MIALVVLSNLVFVALAQTNFPPIQGSTSSSTTVPAINTEHLTTGGLSYSGGLSVLPASSSGQRSTIGQDEFGGHSIQHAAHSAFSNPISGDTDVKQGRYFFHINPYAGQASVITDDAIGGINPDIQSATFYHRRHNARVNPGHGSYSNAADTASVTPQGNHAYQLFRSSTGNAHPNGFFQNRRLAQLYHVNNPQTGGVTKTDFTNRDAFYTPGQVFYRDDIHSAGHGQDRFGNGDIVRSGATYNVNLNTDYGVKSSDRAAFANQFRYNPTGINEAAGLLSQGVQPGQVFIDTKK